MNDDPVRALPASPFRPGLSTRELGSELEQAVARRLEFDGYDAKTNVYLEGRSGGRHEIDVIAVRELGSTTIRLVAECKSWLHVIDKGVIAKAKFVGDDIGADKVLVVAPGGAGPGAEAAARELGVELWGPEECKEHLVGFTDPFAVTSTAEYSTGIPFSVAPTEVDKWLERRCRAGFRRKVVERQGTVKIPCVQVFGSVTTKGMFRSQAEQRWWTFELLGEDLLDVSTSPLPLAPVPPGPFLVPLSEDSGILASLVSALDLLVDRDVAKNAKSEAGKLLNVPSQIDSYSLGDAEVFWLGCYVAVLSYKGRYEFAVLRGLDGKEWTSLETTLSRDFARFSRALAEIGI